MSNKKLQATGRLLRNATGEDAISSPPINECEPKHPRQFSGKLFQWTTGDGRIFLPAGETIKRLPPGLYDINSQNGTIFFKRIVETCEKLISFPDSVSDQVVKEIDLFWKKEATFNRHGLVFKRGILLYGSPGGGKTCVIRMVMKNVIGHGGIIVRFGHSGMLENGIALLREIQCDTPIVIVMEDIDDIIRTSGESCIANLLDGITGLTKCVFLATTNYPEKLAARIADRPSRFDKRFKIGMPCSASRQIYLKNLSKGENIDFNKWTKETDGLSFAHLRELFIAVAILGNDYDETLTRLKEMSSKIDSADDGNKIGLADPCGGTSGWSGATGASTSG